MSNKIWNKVMMGIATGGLFTFIALTIIRFTQIKTTIEEIWLYMLASLIIGIYFGLSSFIFEKENWSPLKQTVIHFSFSIIGFFLIAIPIGWIPFRFFSIIAGIIVFVIIYILNWTGFYLYYKRIEASMNEHLQK